MILAAESESRDQATHMRVQSDLDIRCPRMPKTHIFAWRGSIIKDNRVVLVVFPHYVNTPMEKSILFLVITLVKS